MSKKRSVKAQGDASREVTPLGLGIGMRVRQFREERMLTQNALADAVGIRQSTLARIELGQTVADVQTILLLCHGLDVSEPKMFHGLKDKVSVRPRVVGATDGDSVVVGLGEVGDEPIDGLDGP